MYRNILSLYCSAHVQSLYVLPLCYWSVCSVQIIMCMYIRFVLLFFASLTFGRNIFHVQHAFCALSVSILPMLYCKKALPKICRSSEPGGKISTHRYTVSDIKNSTMSRKIYLLSLNVWMVSNEFVQLFLQCTVVLSNLFELIKKWNICPYLDTKDLSTNY
jgi:hypothetical protein